MGDGFASSCLAVLEQLQTTSPTLRHGPGRHSERPRNPFGSLKSKRPTIATGSDDIQDVVPE